ncbi:MAG: HAD-IIIA family hydrolase, partial [Acidobacteria bacterium]
MSTPAVFLDKDGTLIEDVPYNVNPALITFTERAGEALKLLDSGGFRLIVVSNQAGVARGFFSEHALTAVENKLRGLFSSVAARFGGFYYCPHDAEGSVKQYATNCFCRKPRPGLLLRAALELRIDLEKSWLIGDIL